MFLIRYVALLARIAALLLQCHIAGAKQSVAPTQKKFDPLLRAKPSKDGVAEPRD
jgi:hypothetical protein